MPQLLLLQNVGCRDDDVHPCIAEPRSSNITATMKRPGQQLLTEKDPPAWDQQRVRQTQPSGTVANLIPHLPWRRGGWGGQLWGQAPATLHTSPPTARVRSGHIQGNAGLTSSCSQQGWGLASSATQRVFRSHEGQPPEWQVMSRDNTQKDPGLEVQGQTHKLGTWWHTS